MLLTHGSNIQMLTNQVPSCFHYRGHVKFLGSFLFRRWQMDKEIEIRNNEELHEIFKDEAIVPFIKKGRLRWLDLDDLPEDLLKKKKNYPEF